jgi:hypothetical protein
MLLLAFALLGGLGLSATEPLQKGTTPVELLPKMKQQSLSQYLSKHAEAALTAPAPASQTTSDIPVYKPYSGVEEALMKGMPQSLPMTTDGKYDIAAFTSMMPAEAAAKSSHEGVESMPAGMASLHSKPVSPYGKGGVLTEEVAMSTVPFLIADPDDPSGSIQVIQPETLNRAAALTKGQELPKTTTGAPAPKPSAGPERYFQVEYCAGQPFGNIINPTNPTCFFTCLGVGNLGIPKCCLFNGCYVPPVSLFFLGYCTKCSFISPPPPPVGTVYALPQCLLPFQACFT